MTAAAASLAALWAPLHDEGLEWAYRAYRRFMDTLSADVREHLAQDDGRHEPYVVVFGTTQVGKTTLLLDLMGVRLDVQQRVGQVLRGGREAGKSATATTMEYRRSPDQCWRLDTGAGARVLSDDADMRKALAELRQEMSKRRLHVDAPVVAWIPDDCFELGPGTGIGARMLDLPGDNPEDEVEHEHVKLMAQRYVPYADLILLVGRGDGLGFLSPKGLALPGIEDWQYVPNRFRIVTTYSFTPDSVQKFVRTHAGELTPEHFRKSLLEQIGTFNNIALSPEARDTKRYFPLEFGQSWQDKAKTDGELVRRIDPVLETLKAELHADIKASATEAARFRNALDVHVIAKRKREQCIKEGEASLSRIDARIRVDCVTAAQAAEDARRATERFDAVQKLLAQRKAAEAGLVAELTPDVTEQVDAVGDLATNTGALLERIIDCSSWLRQQFLEMQPSSRPAKAFLGTARPNLAGYISMLNRMIEDEFSALVSHLNHYGAKEYWPSVFNNFSKDTARLKRDIGDAAAKVAKYAHEVWRKELARRATELEAEADEADRERVSLGQVVEQLQAERQQLLAQRVQMQAKMDNDLERLDQDAGTGARFVTMLNEEYLAELQRRRALIANTRSPVEALLALVSVKSLAEERRKIKPD